VTAVPDEPGPRHAHGSVLDVLSLPGGGAGRRQAEVRQRRAELAANGLADAVPDFSARRRINVRKRIIAMSVAAAFVVCAILLPGATALATVAVLIAAYLATLVHRLELMRRALKDDATIYIDDDEARAVPDDRLPVYTVLVPAYREPEVVAAVVASMASIEYPPDRLEVLLLLEEDDEETIAAAEVACRATPIRIVLVPAGEPRTKPKACNYGLMLATGHYVTIYDAEDHPEPLQLRRAVVAFDRAGEDVACLQARLSYHNADQNLITRWFTTEYDVWFRWLLPGLVATGAPIPLGGTSNHIRGDVLRRVGGWDPYNVTEDADLGLRLARQGHRVAVLGSTTMEEANSDFVNWVKQRSRWYKGYLQTFLVHVRSPRRTYRELGFKGMLGLVLFVGGTPVLAMLNPVFWGLTALWWLDRPSFVAELFPSALYYVGMACWILGGLFLVYSGVANARVSGKPQLALAALVVPLYWAMMSLAALKALIQLVLQPSYWEKTTHGLASGGAPGGAGADPDVAGGPQALVPATRPAGG
jgi:cellulose synthase/poly-beta-1,6-N-acetylglucosamine synthase-like glycosyltransferase